MFSCSARPRSPRCSRTACATSRSSARVARALPSARARPRLHDGSLRHAGDGRGLRSCRRSVRRRSAPEGFQSPEPADPGSAPYKFVASRGRSRRRDRAGSSVAYLRQAGLRAMARAANREAIAHLEQALAALAISPRARETTELTIDIRIDLRNALLPLGDRTRMGRAPPRGGGARQDARRPAPARADRHLHGDPVPAHWRLRRGRQIRAGGPEHRANPRRSLDRGSRDVLSGS